MEKQTFAELGAFVAVVKRGSFVKAASDLGVAPSALSQTVRRLEERLGARLINRTTRSLAVTTEGEKLLSRVGPLLTELDASIDAVRRRSTKPSGVVRVNAPRLVALRMIAPRLSQFHAAYPEIVLDVTSDDSFADIVAGRFDVGIRLGERLRRDMIATKFGPDMQMAAVASPRYLAKHGTPKTPEELRGHACLNWRMPSTGARYRWEFQRKNRIVEVEVDGPLASNDNLVLLEAALRGVGIAYLSDAEVAEHLERKKLVRLLEAWSPRFRGFYFYYPHRQDPGSPVRAFVDFFRDGST